MITTQLLERVRAALLGRRTPGRHSSAATPQEAPQAPRRRPTPDVWGARLVTARRTRRGRHAPPVQAQPRPSRDWEAEEAWEPVGAMVRPYVAHLGEAPRHAPTGAQAAPWGNAS
jgi:hypothetical protein